MLVVPPAIPDIPATSTDKSCLAIGLRLEHTLGHYDVSYCMWVFTVAVRRAATFKGKATVSSQKTPIKNKIPLPNCLRLFSNLHLFVFSPWRNGFCLGVIPLQLVYVWFFHCSHGWCHGFTPVNALIDCWSSRLMVTALAVEQLLSCSDIPSYCLKMIKPEWSWEKSPFWAASVWVPWNQELSAG